MTDANDGRAPVSRRDVLRRGGTIAAGVLWVVPAAEFVSMSHAEAASAPSMHAKGTSANVAGSARGGSATRLPDTGGSLPYGETAVIGTTAAAAGATALWLARDRSPGDPAQPAADLPET